MNHLVDFDLVIRYCTVYRVAYSWQSFNLVIITRIAISPNLSPRQIFWLYGTRDFHHSPWQTV